VAVADAFDAMTHDRHYRRARSVAEALEEVHAGAGSQFDPVVASAFVEVIDGAGLRTATDAEPPVALARGRR
jgi:HD-GYP domain-containing protein (c-di-GMP phosphodiesterase class II)